jgi:thymidylate synthase (FAD)
MKIVDASYRILKEPAYIAAVTQCADAARTCYKSNSKGLKQDINLLRNCITKKHESILEHYSVSVLFICDRGISHEIVRHRLASFSQESTRYCNYGKDKFNNELTFIRPFKWAVGDSMYSLWCESMQHAENMYLKMLRMGATPECARSVLPNSLKTEIVVTANIREWRHIFKLRTAPVAHPQIKELMIPLLYDFKQYMNVFFEDIKVKENEHGKEAQEDEIS